MANEKDKKLMEVTAEIGVVTLESFEANLEFNWHLNLL